MSVITIHFILKNVKLLTENLKNKQIFYLKGYIANVNKYINYVPDK